MTAQEMMEQEGYIVWGTWHNGARCVIVGTLTKNEALDWRRRCGLPTSTTQNHFYKAIAE